MTEVHTLFDFHADEYYFLSFHFNADLFSCQIKDHIYIFFEISHAPLIFSYQTTV